MRALRHALAAALLAALLPSAALAAATITIVNGDGPGEGFNDPTAAAPVGGNPGTTVGEQRRRAFEFAAGVWGQSLDSGVEVRILALFDPLFCTANTATLGSAGTLTVAKDFPNAPFARTWYHQALANKIARQDLAPRTPDLRARFNANLGQPGCLAGTTWYYGLDANEGPGQINLVTVLLHEFAHGLGFASFTSVTTGKKLNGHDDVYSRHYYDLLLETARNAMTNQQRRFSAVNTGNVVWTGANVEDAIPLVLSGTPSLFVTAPASLAGTYPVGTAAFGPPLDAAGVSGALAPVGGDALACTLASITNPVAGKIALVSRGVCGFAVKVKNAQLAGAKGVVVYDNAPGGPAGMGGADPTITIPSVRITQALGQALLAATGVEVTLGLDPTRIAGAKQGWALLYAPNPVEPGSSISHFDTSATPNQLMEPFINGDLTTSVEVPVDLTREQLRDVGWYDDADLDGVADADDRCAGTSQTATVVIGGVDTGVRDVADGRGCPFSTRLAAACGDPKGDYSACVTQLGNEFVQGRWMSGADKAVLVNTAAALR